MARVTSFAERTPVLLLAGHAAVWLAVLAWAPAEALADDIQRFVELATSQGIPYRDFPVEYMPLETLLIRMLGATAGQVSVRVVGIAAACDVAVYLLVASLFGRRASIAYLWFALPLQLFMLYRLDLVTVVVLLVAFVAAGKERPVLAGTVFAVAFLFKPWPIVLLPVLARRAGTRGVLAFGGVALTGVAAWLVVGGVDAIRYVATFRDATGWQIESTVGALIGILGTETPRFELGAMRIGEMGTVAAWGLRVIGLIGVLAVWWRARSSRWDPAGAPSAAAVAVLVATAPVASAQYVSWIVPWCALAVTERRRVLIAVACGSASVLAAASFVVYWDIAGGIRLLELLAVARAVSVATIALAWLVERAKADDGGVDRASHAG